MWTPSIFRRKYLTYILLILFFANFLNYLDRQIVSSLEIEICAAFDLDKSHFGLLWTAFTIGYMVFAPIVGYLTDRYRRTRIFAVCVLVWSVATIGSGLVQQTFLLYVMRFLIGIGEAGCLVIGPTLITDFFSKETRGRALSMFYLGLPLGGTAGYLVGGFVSELTGDWSNAFYAAGIPGIVVAVLIWFLADPPRGGRETQIRERIHGFRPYLDLFRNRTLILVILAQAFAVVILVPILHFGVNFFESERGMSKKQAITALGTVALIAGILGNSLSGVIGDKLAKRLRGAYAMMAGFGYTLGLPWLILGFTTESAFIFLPSLTIGATCFFLCMPAINAQIANVVSAKQRAMAFAMAVFLLHFLGDMAAPPVFGLVAQKLGSDQQAFFLFSFALLAAGACCFVAARTARADMERFSGEVAPQGITGGMTNLR